ncbi:YeeE/YedE family protein [Alphaproteobacteria bacterium LSUCC0684]
MQIDLDHFTPYLSLTGGVLIGLAALLLLLLNGRVMGISGIMGGLVSPGMEPGDRSWRLVFVIGVILGPFLVMQMTGDAIEIRPAASGFWLMASGLIIGLGTAIGSGCTSGHGICGMARLSIRSIVAVMIFMASAVVTVGLVRHVF